jgi:hypothetical protein
MFTNLKPTVVAVFLRLAFMAFPGGSHLGTAPIRSESGNGVIIWPRHEVIQLINPSLSHSGRTLSNSLAVEASRHLAKLQSLDGSIRSSHFNLNLY